ncbi:phosphate ABC transporter permease subunit PstC [Austwickia sp. TVS 96-490-7B]|uniref:phosphate ABC transporter permease subunit PstC n=1 Tax=Austwickia sp. TVS 96-490-7B TaxID=2830843 RepID=UPI002102A2C4|nr:phosphate ABC transporter permease subunit PstC [Austwickia sp. TVS 96-490-7B]
MTRHNSPPAPNEDAGQQEPAEGEPASGITVVGLGHTGDRILAWSTWGAGVGVALVVTMLGAFLAAQAWPALQANSVDFLTSREWQIDGTPLRFGVLDLIWATVVSATVAMAVAVPFGVAIALFLTHYAPRWLRGPGSTLIDLLAAIPSVVYGLWGLATVIPLFTPIQTWLQTHAGGFPLCANAGITGGTLLLIGLVLAIMILPIVTALSREVFAQVPPSHIEGALALGATRWEMIRVAVLPYGRPGVMSAAMLGLGRALGETIAVTFLVSSLPVGSAWSWSLFNGGETFASKIANNAAEFNDPTKTGAYIAAGLVLFVLTFVVNALARLVIDRRKAFAA